MRPARPTFAFLGRGYTLNTGENSENSDERPEVEKEKTEISLSRALLVPEGRALRTLSV